VKRADQREQSGMFLGTCRTALEMFAHPDDQPIGVLASELVLDVHIEQLEAPFAGELGTGWAEQRGNEPLGGLISHRAWSSIAARN
jgi:hypothetical protein